MKKVSVDWYIQQFLKKNTAIQINNFVNNIEVTVFYHGRNHNHYQDTTIIGALGKAYTALFKNKDTAIWTEE